MRVCVLRRKLDYKVHTRNFISTMVIYIQRLRFKTVITKIAPANLDCKVYIFFLFVSKAYRKKTNSPASTVQVSYFHYLVYNLFIKFQPLSELYDIAVDRD